MKVSVVILNWNTAGYLRQFLPSLLDSTRGLDAQIVVADNASSDGSPEMLLDEFPSVKVLRLDRNYGFTGGYDRAVDMLCSDGDAPQYIVLLNSDVEVTPTWLEPLIGFMDTHPDCGVCGPKLLALAAEDGKYRRLDTFEYAGAAGGMLDRYGFPFCRGRVLGRLERDNGQYDTTAQVMWISGACMMTRTSLWKELGGLDRRFFAHMEEIDYCWRAQLLGYSVYTVPQSCVYHIGGGTLPNGSATKLKLNYRNSLLMLYNNLPATIGPAKAKCRIASRRMADRVAALAYLLSGDRDSFHAVRLAHREAGELRFAASGTPPPQRSGKRICGYTGFSIVVKSLLHGKNIFNYLRRYEDSHRGCR